MRTPDQLRSLIRSVAVVALGIGIALLVFAVWLETPREERLSAEEERIAFAPLCRFPLSHGDNEPLTARMRLPDTVQWRKIRRLWGEPDVVVTAVGTAKHLAICLPKSPLRVEIVGPSMRAIPLRPGTAPYGYSALCESSSLRFRAAPGDELTVEVTSPQSNESGADELIVQSDWFNTKDKIVGEDFNRDFANFARWIATLGLVFCLSSLGLFLKTRSKAS